MNEAFHRFARLAAEATGSPWAFTMAVVILILWAALGPLFEFSNGWQLSINTAASIVPTLMVFLIQNTQNRDARAMHLKIDTLIADAEGARSSYIGLESLSESDMDRLAASLRRREGNEGDGQG